MNKRISRNILAIWLCLILTSHLTLAQEICPIIPLPEFAEKNSETFILNRNVAILLKDERIENVAHYLQNELLRLRNVALSIQDNSQSPKIILSYDKQDVSNPGSYRLNISANIITISSFSNEGLFNGINSLLQLVQNQKDTKELTIPGWTIKDKPLYTWRGLMLDESRHFFGKEKVKQILNWMAFYKLNKFHWHLTDQPAWRIEIKQYPKLTLVGGIGDHYNEFAPVAYYSQEDIKEIVSYAKERFITVIPEIDMPGHAGAAKRAYPEYSGGGSKSHPEFTFNPGKESTYQYLTNIIKEVDALFPSQIIHIGGDEVHYGNENWSTNADIKDLVKRKNLGDMKSVENYFIERMADSVMMLNNKVMAWDEVADSKLSPSETIVLFWRHNRPEQLVTSLEKGFSVVLSPRDPMYFDYQQDTTQVHGPSWKKFSLNSLERVYDFSKEKLNVEIKNPNLILGMQANLWTERIITENRLDYMLFPRIAALAEAAWTRVENKDFKKFEKRLKTHLPLYKEDGLYYFNPFEPSLTGEPVN